MADVANLEKFDAFADAETTSGVETGFIHIRVQQRTTRSYLTTVQGLSDRYDKKKILKWFRKLFACNGTVIDHKEFGNVIQLQGDKRKECQEFLMKYKFAQEHQIKVHGF